MRPKRFPFGPSFAAVLLASGGACLLLGASHAPVRAFAIGAVVLGLTMVLLALARRSGAAAGPPATQSLDPQLLAAAIDQSPVGAVVTDAQGRIEFVNPAFERITGYRRLEVLGQNPRILKSGRHDAAFYREMWTTLAAGSVWRGELINRRKDGSLYNEEQVIAPVRTAGGAITHFVALKLDVTERRATEDKLRQAQKMEAVGRLAGGIAHDFNNLIGVITGYGDLLLRDVGPEHPGTRRLAEIRKAADRAADLTRQLLAFSRKQILEPTTLDLNSVVRGVAGMLQRVIGEDVDLVLVLEPGLGSVRADPGQLEQVILNLAVNARDAMPRGGRLEVSTANLALDDAFAGSHPGARAGSCVRLAVSDTGEGMGEATLRHIFEPFFTTKGAGKGTGLGLATVYGIVKQSGGYVTVSSAPGEGATFEVYLPRVESAPPAEPRLLPQTLATRPPDAPRDRPTTILLAEDEPALFALIQEVLEEAGYRLLACGDAEEALRLAGSDSGPIDLLVTDVVMPHLDGPSLAHRIRTARPEIRVLYMSGYTDEALGGRGVLEPGQHLIQKPFTSEELLRKVMEVVER